MLLQLLIEQLYLLQAPLELVMLLLELLVGDLQVHILAYLIFLGLKVDLYGLNLDLEMIVLIIELPVGRFEL